MSLGIKAPALGALSSFVGRHLAWVSNVLVTDGVLCPCGMTLDLSLWHGATENYTQLVTDDPNRIQEMAEDWFLTDHKKAKFVSVAVDGFITLDGARTDAAILLARTKDHSIKVIVYQPYIPGTDASPIRLQPPVVDFGKECAHLLPKRDFVLENVLKGRNGSPLKSGQFTQSIAS